MHAKICPRGNANACHIKTKSSLPQVQIQKTPLSVNPNNVRPRPRVVPEWKAIIALWFRTERCGEGDTEEEYWPVLSENIAMRRCLHPHSLRPCVSTADYAEQSLCFVLRWNCVLAHGVVATQKPMFDSRNLDKRSSTTALFFICIARISKHALAIIKITK